MCLTAGVPPGLLDLDVAPPLLLVLGRGQAPCGCGPWFIETRVVLMSSQCDPAGAIFRNLELPISQGRSDTNESNEHLQYTEYENNFCGRIVLPYL